MIPAVIYARYSSLNQREESIAGQIRDCKAYADRNGYTVIREYTDSALTGRTDRRPGFQQMIADAEKHDFQIVIVWKLDRFARNRYDSAMYRNKLKKHGVRLYSAMENITDSPEGIILEGLMESLAEYYSANLGENVKRGMYDSALQHKVLSSPCFGYHRGSDGKYEIDPEQAPIVRDIFTAFNAGETKTEIIDRLNRQGIKTRQKKPFNKNSLRNILTNEKYIGIYRYKDIYDPNGIPPIVDVDLFNSVQSKLEYSSKHRKTHCQEQPYILTSILFCGHCGAAMTGESVRSSNGNTYRYYTCVNTKGRIHTCGKQRVPKDLIEREVMRIVNDEILTDEKIEELAHLVVESQKTDTRANEIKNMEQNLKQIDVKIGRLTRSIETAETIPHAITNRIAELEKEKTDLTANIAKQKAMIFVHEYDDIVSFLYALKNLSETGSDTQRILIDATIKRIYIFDCDDGFELSIEMNTGSGSDPVSLSRIVRFKGKDPSHLNLIRTINSSIVIFAKIRA